MKNLRIETRRLELIAADLETVKAEAQSRAQLSSLLGAQVPDAWPPQFYDESAVAFTLEQLKRNPENAGWWSWYFVLKTPRTLIGVGGFKGAPDENREVEIGYSVLQKFQRQGFCSEAVVALVNWAQTQGATAVAAETLPELVASIRVLEKNGFAFVGDAAEAGVIRYRKPLA